MISLDQVLLLEKKVESAVEKIQQLQNENDALRKKCAELTNALSSKSEQLSNYELDQNQIEEGIRNALNRLTLIENSVLKAAGSAPAKETTSAPNFGTMKVLKVEESTEDLEQETEPQPALEDLFDKTIGEVTGTADEVEEPAYEQPVEEQIPEEISIPTKPYIEETVSTPVPFGEDIPDDSIPSDFEPDFDSEEYPEDNPTDNLGFDIF